MRRQNASSFQLCSLQGRPVQIYAPVGAGLLSLGWLLPPGLMSHPPDLEKPPGHPTAEPPLPAGRSRFPGVLRDGQPLPAEQVLRPITLNKP